MNKVRIEEARALYESYLSAKADREAAREVLRSAREAEATAATRYKEARRIVFESVDLLPIDDDYACG